MTEIQKATMHPQRCILAHPILPPHLIPLVEIAGGAATSPETAQKTQQFLKSIGKTPIILNKEVPGYIVNRLQAALWREAISLVAQGVANAEAVDTAFCLGIGLRDPLLGPFLRAHIAGNGIEHFLHNYAQSYNNRWTTMETWTSVPSSAAQKVINSVHRMPVIQTPDANNECPHSNPRRKITPNLENTRLLASILFRLDPSTAETSLAVHFP
jgi:3-hydroxyacyl-CoA dehydrogenase